jgi:hypothetical protein
VLLHWRRAIDIKNSGGLRYGGSQMPLEDGVGCCQTVVVVDPADFGIKASEDIDAIA